jgi:hypothetical protein
MLGAVSSINTSGVYQESPAAEASAHALAPRPLGCGSRHTRPVITPALQAFDGRPGADLKALGPLTP